MKTQDSNTRKCSLDSVCFSCCLPYLSVRLFCLSFFVRSFFLACFFLRLPLCFDSSLSIPSSFVFVCMWMSKSHSFIHFVVWHMRVLALGLHVCVCPFVCLCARCIPHDIDISSHTHFLFSTSFGLKLARIEPTKKNHSTNRIEHCATAEFQYMRTPRAKCDSLTTCFWCSQLQTAYVWVCWRTCSTLLYHHLSE